MTTWANMSKTKRSWMVYRAVRCLVPDATFEGIRDDLQTTHGVKISAFWLRERLDRFVAAKVLSEEHVMMFGVTTDVFNTARRSASGGQSGNAAHIE